MDLTEQRGRCHAVVVRGDKYVHAFDGGGGVGLITAAVGLGRGFLLGPFHSLYRTCLPLRRAALELFQPAALVNR